MIKPVIPIIADPTREISMFAVLLLEYYRMINAELVEAVNVDGDADSAINQRIHSLNKIIGKIG
jgi:hypothetical protein